VQARLLTLEEAAAYCGIPTRNFRKHIGIAPVKLGPNELWDRQRLDAHIDALQGGGKAAVTGEQVDWKNVVKSFKKTG
jgi:hypothetical protein